MHNLAILFTEISEPPYMLRHVMHAFSCLPQPTSSSVALKYGLDISELTSGSGTEIEIDTEALETQESSSGLGGAGNEYDQQYDKSEVYEQVSLEPIIGARGDSSESESDDGLV